MNSRSQEEYRSNSPCAQIKPHNNSIIPSCPMHFIYVQVNRLRATFISLAVDIGEAFIRGQRLFEGSV